MQPTTVILLALMMLAYARTRSLGKTRHAWLQQFGGWQRVFGTVAVIMALIIVLNPEFYALGLLGDAAFFDMLALALALQMHVYIGQAVRICLTAWPKAMRILGIPSPGLLYLLDVSSSLLTRVLPVVQKLSTRSLSQV
jgi:hypothetical protein